MIGWIRGVIVDRPEIGKLVIETEGVGYDVETSHYTFFKLETAKETVGLHIHTIVREDAILLYGFLDKQERSLFRMLIKVNGIGPKLAMSILSSISPSEFYTCLKTQDALTLVKLPGVGKKTAERLIIELKDKFNDTATSIDILPNSAKQEAMFALESLGYKSNMATQMIKAVAKEGLSSEELIRAALKSVKA
ncbi:MAG: Holliday junction DNA helicase RuvA [Legionellales bacterium RIFCSPHIGHO2_12_FULL_37_14]|nr:MAG: Holliday junction DNA helicase RuvA [Legionellales bacterium RIFCSPHIGHO2_12_FULL_37_14]